MEEIIQQHLIETGFNIETLLNFSTATEQPDYNYVLQDPQMAKFKADLSRIGEGYLLFILCVLGIIGNTLAFATFSTKPVRKSTTSAYLRALAVADIFVLVTALFRYKTYKIFLTEEGELDSVFYFDAYAEVYIEPLHWISLGSSSFITIALSLERYMAVKFPLFTKRSCSIPVVLVCISMIVIAAVSIASPNFASYEVVQIDFIGITAHVASLTEFGRDSLFPCTFHNYIVPILWYIIPASLLTVLNILLSVHVQKSTRIRVGLPGISNPNRNLSVLIILIVSVYMLCNFPKCIFMFYKLITQMSNNTACVEYTSKINAPDSKTFLIIQVITELLNVLNSCMNFVVYCLVGSRFRRELKKLIMCKCCKRRHPWTLRTRSIHPQSSVLSGISGRLTNKLFPKPATSNEVI